MSKGKMDLFGPQAIFFVVFSREIFAPAPRFFEMGVSAGRSSAAGEKIGIFFARRRRKFLDFSTLTKDLDTPPVGGVPSVIYGK